MLINCLGFNLTKLSLIYVRVNKSEEETTKYLLKYQLNN